MDEKDILLKTIEGLKRYFHLDSCVWICMRVKRLQRKSLIKKKEGVPSPKPHFRDRAGIRTQDPQLRRLLLYPAELPDHPLFGGAKVGIFP